MPEVTKAVALVLLLGALTVVPPRHRLLTVLMLPGRATPEDGALGAEVAAEKAAEDGVLSTLACCKAKAQTHGRWSWNSQKDSPMAGQTGSSQCQYWVT